MIIRRIVQRLKQQEWTAVMIEIAIVVLGVFIGIQVSNWNEDRKERSLEAIYLQRIAADVRSDVAEIDGILRVSTLRMAVLNQVLRDATGRELPTGFESARGSVAVEEVPALAADDRNSPSFALFILDTLDGNRSAYDTVISTGGIGLMRDAAMLGKVQAYYASVDKVLHFEAGLEQNRDKLVDAERRVGISPMDSRTTAELASAFAADRELLATAQNYWLYTNRHIRLMRELRQQANALADDIGRRGSRHGNTP